MSQIKDFAVTTQGKIYAISMSSTQSSTNTLNQGSDISSLNDLSKVVLKDEQPIFVDASGKIIG